MAIQGFGVTFEYENPSDTWVTVGEVIDVTPPSVSKDTIDTTHHGTSNGQRTFLGGLVDAGEATVEVNYDITDTGHVYLRGKALTANDSPTGFRFTYSDGASTVETFEAIVTGFEASTPIDDRVTASITLKLSGGLTYA